MPVPAKLGPVLNGGKYEHLDDLVYCPSDRMAWGIHNVPRCWRSHPHPSRLCGDIARLAFCDGQSNSLRPDG